MKNLKEYMYEGLFNVDKNITDTHELEKNMFEDRESPWWEYCVIYNGRVPVNEWSFAFDRITKKIDIDREVIDIQGVVGIDSNYPNPFSNKYTLNCEEFIIGQPGSCGPHPEPISNGGGFKEINCTGVTIDGMCEKLNGFKFNIDPGRGRMSAHAKINWVGDLDYCGAEFNFIGNTDSVFILQYVRDWPNLKDIESNARNISMYDSMFFDNDSIKEGLNKFFGDGTITANGITKKKNIRNIVAVVNNTKKYGVLLPTEVIPVGSLSDLIDVRGFNNLKRVIMRSNNVKMTFIRPDNKQEVERHAKFVRLNNLKLFKDTPIQDLIDMVLKCQTKDGWVVLFEPETF